MVCIAVSKSVSINKPDYKNVSAINSEKKHYKTVNTTLCKLKVGRSVQEMLGFEFQRKGSRMLMVIIIDLLFGGK